MRTSKTYLLPLMLALLASCSAKKFLPEGERYFSGHVFETDPNSEKIPAEMMNQLADELRPDPVNKVFAARPGVWLHHVMGEVKKEKGIKYWLKYQLGDKPVYLSDVTVNRNAGYIEDFLQSEGFFRARVESSIDSSKREAKVRYLINQSNPYHIGKIELCDTPDTICQIMDALLQNTQVRRGARFSQNDLSGAREQIGNHFRSNGFYYFRPEFVLFQADSTAGNRTVHMKVSLKEKLDTFLLQRYTINEIWLDLSDAHEVKDTLKGPVNVLLSAHKPFIKPDKLLPFIAIEPNQLYSLADQRITLRQLNRLNIFEFVNLSYNSDTAGSSTTLRAHIDGRALLKQSVSAEIDINTTSNNFTGPGINIEYNNRNLLRGAESLRITGVGRYETQLSGARRGLSSFEFDLKADLLVPRRGGLNHRLNTHRGNVPRTRYGAQYRIIQQGDFYTQSALSLNYGVEWTAGTSHFHNISLLGVTFLRLLNSSAELDELLSDNPFFRESFENQFIIGPNYTYTYNPSWKAGHRLRWFFSGNIDLSGNVLSTAYSLAGVDFTNPGDYTLGGIPFSQYSRFQIDNRLTLKLSRTSELVFRQNIGVGFAYGNSNTMPFAKQFFVGGAISMRAFQPRSIGPGSFFNEDQEFGSFFDQTGDYLAEFNLEYRFGKGGYLEGAIFTDVGNVWLQRPSENRPGGAFDWRSAPQELAVATGVGLRMDFTFLLLRFDLAFPLRLPYLPEGDRWIIDQINPLMQDWRRDNLLLNVAIGYPF